MSVQIHIDLFAKPEKVEELKQVFKEIVPDTRSFEGCVQCAVYVDQDDPNHLAIIETFASRPDYEKYLAWRLERGDLDALGAMLDGPLQTRFYDDIGA